MRHTSAIFLSLLLLSGPALAQAPSYDEDDIQPGDTYAQPQPGDPYAQPQPGFDPQAQPAEVQPQVAPTECDPSQCGIGYVGAHPIPYEYGSGFCYTEGAHTHDYAPFDANLFREYNGYYYFVGDPSDFGYEREVYGYNGNHPIPLAWGGGYCYINWPHRHHYQPTGVVGFSLIGGYWIYGGVFPADYYLYRNYYSTYYTGYYRNYYYGNRYWVVRPPPVYRYPSPVRVGAPPGRTFVASPPPALRIAGAPTINRTGVMAPPPTFYRPRMPGAIGSPYRPGVAPIGGGSAMPLPGYRPGVAPMHAPSMHSPSMMAPRPSYAPSMAPTYRPAPVYHAPPAYRSPSPSFHSPSPSYHSPSPSFRPSPSYHAPSPSFSRPSYSPAPSFHGGGGFRRR